MRRFRLGLRVAVLAASGWACVDLSSLSRYACEPDGGCGEGRTCCQGYCVVERCDGGGTGGGTGGAGGGSGGAGGGTGGGASTPDGGCFGAITWMHVRSLPSRVCAVASRTGDPAWFATRDGSLFKVSGGLVSGVATGLWNNPPENFCSLLVLPSGLVLAAGGAGLYTCAGGCDSPSDVRGIASYRPDGGAPALLTSLCEEGGAVFAVGNVPGAGLVLAWDGGTAWSERPPPGGVGYRGCALRQGTLYIASDDRVLSVPGGNPGPQRGQIWESLWASPSGAELAVGGFFPGPTTVSFGGRVGGAWQTLDTPLGGSAKSLAGPDLARLRAAVTRSPTVLRGSTDGGWEPDNAGLDGADAGFAIWSDAEGCSWWLGGGNCDAGGCVFSGRAQ